MNVNVLDPEKYTIAWIAPLEIEARAALLMLDKRHRGRFPLSPGDDYVYEAGEICNHNVIIATLPSGQAYGKGSAAAIASQVKKFFPRLWFGLLVGVAAGLPNLQRTPPLDIRLGDVLVALPEGESAGLIDYDLGKETGSDGFQLLQSGHVLAKTETVVRSAIGSIKLNAPDDTELFLPYYNHIKDREHSQGSFADPGQENDLLYNVDDDGDERLVSREPRPDCRRTHVWYGPIGSGDKLMKNARKRNELRDRYKVIGLEMEAAGTMNRIPVGVIRGVCDYGDEHKNKQWQPYAAAMAASYAKAVLAQIPPKVVVRIEGQILDSDSSLYVVPSRPRRLLDNSFSSAESRMPKSPRCDNSDAAFSQPSPIQQENLGRDRIKAILESLAFDQIDSRHDTINRAYGKTCEWLLTTPEYRAWLNPNKLDEHHGFLWIKGNPGAGKSTIMKFVLQTAQKSKQSKCIAFFFNALGVDLEKSTIGMYRSLLLQVLEKIPRLQVVLNSLRIRNSNISQWSMESLQSLFEQAIENLGKTPLTCFIDALDECDDAQIKEMVSFFEELAETVVSRNILFRVCLSSRHYPHITIAKGLILDLGEQQGHNQDIVKYVNGKLKINDSKLAQRVRKGLIEKASGVFIWVVLVIGILQQEHDDGHTHMLLQRLNEIPKDLNSLFRDILTRDSRHKAEVLLCIQWVLFARHPLRHEQLYVAIRIGIDPSAMPHLGSDAIGEADLNRFILSSSKGLLEISSSMKSSRVQFIHESVREFFFKEDLTKLWPKLNGNFRGESHERLKQCCHSYMKLGVTYLSSRAQSSGLSNPLAIRNKFPLLAYTFRNILNHAEESAASGIDQTNFLESFNLHAWLQCESIFEQSATCRHHPNTSLLYILAESNAASLIGYHRDKLCGFQEEEDTPYRTPILAAIATNSRQAVYAMLKAQADTESSTSILHQLCEDYAQRKGRRAFTLRQFKLLKEKDLLANLYATGENLVVSFLLTTPHAMNLNITRSREISTTLLCEAAESGRENLVRQLLRQDVDIDGFHNLRAMTALQLAICQNHDEIVRLLLDNNASIEMAHDLIGLRPLHLACERGSEAIARLLLSHGADVNARCGTNNYTPLHCAVGYGTIVQLLLDYKAQTEIEGCQGNTPLFTAAEQGRVGTIQILLNNGANIEAVNKMGHTPLTAIVLSSKYWTMTLQKKASVQLLLNRGASIHALDKDGNTPLSLAKSLPDDDLIKSLILAKHDERLSTNSFFHSKQFRES